MPVFTGVTNDMRIARDEIFGPMLSILRTKVGITGYGVWQLLSAQRSEQHFVRWSLQRNSIRR
jgi:Aldehyde dehydrogenase family